MLAERSDSRQRLPAPPLACGDAGAQVTLNPLTWPLSSPHHPFMIATVIRQLPSLSPLTLDLLVSPELSGVVCCWNVQFPAHRAAPDGA